MTSHLRRRLDRLDNQLSGSITAIIVHGGLQAGRENDSAAAGEMNWNRHDGESVADFRARAKAEARAAGKQFLVFGGLPDV